MRVCHVCLLGLLLGLIVSVDAFDPIQTVKISAQKVQAYVARACGCMAGKPKPKTDIVRADVINRACGCAGGGAKPRPRPQPQQKTVAADDGGKLFVESAVNFISILKGSIDINKTGKLNGLGDIFAGIQGLAQLIANARSPQEAARSMTDFLYSLDEKELTQLMSAARSLPAAQ